MPINLDERKKLEDHRFNLNADLEQYKQELSLQLEEYKHDLIMVQKMFASVLGAYNLAIKSLFGANLTALAGILAVFCYRPEANIPSLTVQCFISSFTLCLLTPLFLYFSQTEYTYNPEKYGNGKPKRCFSDILCTALYILALTFFICGVAGVIYVLS